MTETLNFFIQEPKIEVKKYRISGAKFEHYCVSSDSNDTAGFGGALSAELAQTKALFEFFERSVFREKSGNAETSSGWAAHSECEIAKKNSALELIERDAILCSWILKIPPKIIGTVVFDIFGEKFPILQFGTGRGFHVLGTILRYQNLGRILINTTGTSIESCIENLQVDAERAKLVLQCGVSDPRLYAHHRSFCDLDENELSWLYRGGDGISYSLEDLLFNYKLYKLPLWNNTEAWVAHAQCKQLQKLYFGNSHFKNLNRKRIRQVGTVRKKLNRRLSPIL